MRIGRENVPRFHNVTMQRNLTGLKNIISYFSFEVWCEDMSEAADCEIQEEE